MANSYTVDFDITPPSPGLSDPGLPLSRYRHPGDVIRLILGGLLLVTLLVVAIVAPDRSLGTRATTVTGLGPDTAAGWLLVGLVQLAALAATAAVTFELLRRRRFRLLASLAGGAVLAGLIVVGLMHILSPPHPAAVLASIRHGSC